MAERRLHGLQRVLGVNALFSTAYGNVGSSIYYALGLVASFALGLTPVVFVITGFFFFMTASTYAEATAMYPEAGGSSSFARRAFNEFWSFFAAWAQMLNYVITIAISAFFVPHYVGGLFWEELQSAPGDIIAGIIIVLLLCAVNVVGVKESAGVNVTLAVLDFATQLLLVLVGVVLVLSPSVLVDNVSLGVAPTWHDFFLAIPIGMIAYTGIETISNMAEEAKDAAKTIPAAINRVVIAVFAIYSALPVVALSALPVFKDDDGTYKTLLGEPEADGGFAGDPILGVVKHMDLGALQDGAEIYVGILAATILLIATNAGIIGVSRLVYSMGMHRQMPDRLRRLHPRYGTPWIGIVIFGGFASSLAILPGQAAFLGNIYAFGAMLSFSDRAPRADPSAFHAARRRAAISGTHERPRVRSGLSGVRTHRTRRYQPGLRGGDGSSPRRGGRGGRLARDRLWGVRRISAQPGPRPAHDREGRDPQAGRRAGG